MEAEDSADAVLDGDDAHEMLERLADLRLLMLTNRPRMIKWSGC